MSGHSPPDDLHSHALTCLQRPDPAAKVACTRQLCAAWQSGALSPWPGHTAQPVPVPGRPSHPLLVPPRDLARRSAHSVEGRAALIHALCHIEFNAINLALDAVYRFADMPHAFYSDWLRVASEEASHFELLAQHLQQLGYAYGHFPAHNGLWEMATQTDHDVMVRMALVPRVLEARGLDVTPGIIDKLLAAGDMRAVEILRIIEHDEVGHVEIGSRWFRYVCEQRGLSPFSTFKQLLKQYMKGQLKGPFNHQRRKQAGFSEAELAYLDSAG